MSAEGRVVIESAPLERLYFDKLGIAGPAA